MTANQKAQARIFFENRILKADNQAFEDLFTEIMRYKEPDFRSIKPWGNIGDRKNDGYIPSRGVFYQVYAPENIENSYPKLIKKIKDDASGLIKQWSDVKEFYFVVNDKYKGVNADSEQLLTQIKEDNGLDESKFITASDLENILFSLSDDQIIKITGVSFIDNPILTPAILQNSYLKKFSTISLLTTDTPKPIDDIFVNLAIIKEREEKQEKQIPERQIYNNNWEEIHKPKEPIDIEELVNKSNKSLIYGKAGIGKTTLCKYIAYKWAKGELYNEFEYLIYIPLREWKKDGIKGAILDYYYSLDEKNITIGFDANKTLFLFDGYDELDGDKKKILRDEIEHYHLINYIITTRPYGYQKSDFRIDKYFETIGFTDEDVVKYINNFFGEESKKVKSLNDYLKNSVTKLSVNIGNDGFNLTSFLFEAYNPKGLSKHIAHIPLILEMICSQWEQEEFSDDMTMTELYKKVIEDLLSEYARKKGYRTVYEKKYKSKIETYLGSIAFQALKKQTIIINGTFLEKSLKKIKTDNADDFLEQSIFYTGFLKSDNSSKDPWKNAYQFPHLTFQEYFSALYVSGLKPKKQKKIIQEWKFHPHMQIFFAFLGGLIKNKELLLNEIESEPRDFGIYSFLLILTCMNEMKVIELDKSKVEAINRRFINLIIDTLESELVHLLLDKLEKHFKFIDETMMNGLFVLAINSNINSLIRAMILKILLKIENNTSIIEYSLEFVSSEEIESFSKIELISSLEKLNLTNIQLKTIPDIDILKEIGYIGDKDEKKVKIKDKVEIAISLLKNEKNDDIILSSFLEFIHDDSISFSKKSDFALSLSPLIRNNKNIFIKELIQILMMKNLRAYISESFIDAIIICGITDRRIIKDLIEFIKDKRIVVVTRRNILQLLLKIKQDHNEIKNTLLSLIEDDNISFIVKVYIAEALIKVEIKNQEIINILLQYLADDSIHISFKIDIVYILINRGVQHKIIFFTLFKVINYTGLDGDIKEEMLKFLAEIILKRPQLNIFLNPKFFDMEDYIHMLLIHIDIKYLFLSYDNNAIPLSILIDKILYKALPIYLKNKKLHTVENGEKVWTEREVDAKVIFKRDSKVLEEWKALLDRDDCK